MSKNYLVIKPWGSEYTFYSNKLLSSWLLEMNYLAKTSLHCHPKKKTGLILVDGKVQVNIGFYEKITLNAPAKIMIRPGLFHATQCLSKKGCKIIELETPIDKNDLVRFKDNYGRSQKPYEGKKYMFPLPSSKKVFKKIKFDQVEKINFGKSLVTLLRVKSEKRLRGFQNKDIIGILEGGLVDKKNRYVLAPGDLVRFDTIKKLRKVFKIHKKKFMTILRVVKSHV